MQTIEQPAQKPIEYRRALLLQQVQIARSRGARVEAQNDTMAVVVYGKPVNHILHLILTLITAGAWLLVWLVLVLAGGEKRWLIQVDDAGNILTQQAAGPVAIPPAVVAATAPGAPASSIADNLDTLKRMLDDGLITQEEYDAKRVEILKRL